MPSLPSILKFCESAISFIHPGSTFVAYLREASSKIAKHLSFPSFPYVVACFEFHGFHSPKLEKSKTVGVSVPQLESPCDFLPFPNIILTANPWHVPHLRIPEPPEANRRPIAFGKPRIFGIFFSLTTRNARVDPQKCESKFSLIVFKKNRPNMPLKMKFGGSANFETAERK